MKQPPSIDSTAELIRSLPALPKERLIALWQENFGKPAGSIRAELMLPVLAFWIQEKAYGGLDAAITGRLREITDSLALEEPHLQRSAASVQTRNPARPGVEREDP